MGPFAALGSARTQWAEQQQVKESKAYLQKMTSTTKNLMQITFIPDAGGQINWIAGIGDAFTSINKCAASLQSDKWEAEKQLPDATRIPTALVTARRHFEKRVTKLDKELVLQERSFQGPPVLCLGDVLPSWMQRLANDALAK